MSKSIFVPLTKDQLAVIDETDADLLAFKWCASKSGKAFYAQRAVKRADGVWTIERLHRVIAARMGISGNPDHKNRDSLDCRRENLRPATPSQNSANRSRQSNNTSGFKGVSFRRRAGKWRADIKVHGKQRSIGLFSDPVEAARAYDEAAKKTFGEFASLNFTETK